MKRDGSLRDHLKPKSGDDADYDTFMAKRAEWIAKTNANPTGGRGRKKSGGSTSGTEVDDVDDPARCSSPDDIQQKICRTYWNVMHMLHMICYISYHMI